MVLKFFRIVSSLLITNGKLLIAKILCRKKIFFPLVHVISANTHICVEKNGIFRFGKMTNITKGELCVRNNGTLTIGDRVYANKGLTIICRDSIEVGNDTIFGPNVFIYDHNHAISDEGIVLKKEFSCSSVKIGNNCWIGAGTIILAGTILGDNCIVGAGSVLKGTYPDKSRIIQKRITQIDEI